MFQVPRPDPIQKGSSFLQVDSKQDLDIGESVLGSVLGRGRMYWGTSG